ncbi:hypothetical protein FGK63_02880 [Ruegeria sediminis]|uniref:Terminase small subunit n=1 Tax=Ruegeria sediminis TaxID=2583820 RepID=A0ABY2X3R1_9RHOB|nr:hypothetical protein [Ruegeria sediminis]TMV10022.1 hypothetical protein FGK63_02880 [Ruegeria sediminis]
MSKRDSESYEIRTELWARAAHWNVDQMCWLALGCDPQKVRRSKATPELSDEQSNLVLEIQDVLDTRYDGTAKSRSISPKDARDLLSDAGIQLPKPLSEAIDRATVSGSTDERTKSATTKELNTLRKILLVLAVEKFDHGPSNGAGGRISEAALTRAN